MNAVALNFEAPGESSHRFWRAMVIALGFAVAVASFVTLGATKPIGAIIGVILVIVVALWPTVGLIGLIISGTTLQVLGSSHIIGTPMSLGKLFGVLTSAAFVAWALRERKRLTYAPAMSALLAFMAAVLVSTIVMPNKAQSLDGLGRLTQVFMLYFLIANLAAQSRRALWAVCLTLTLAMCACSVIGIAEFVLPSMQVMDDDPRLEKGTLGAMMDFESAESGAIKRVSGGIGDANTFSYMLAATLPLSLFWWRRAGTPAMKFLVAGATLLQLVGIALSYTRTGLMAMTLATAYLVLRRRIPLLPVIAFGFIGVSVAIAVMPATFYERMFTTRYLNEGSTPFRKVLMSRAWDAFQQRPLMGHGYGQFGPYFFSRMEVDTATRIGWWGTSIETSIDEGLEDVHNIGAHNLILEVAVEYGLMGLIPFVGFILLSITGVRTIERGNDAAYADLAVCISAGLLAFCACGMLSHGKLIKVVWMLGGLSAALRRRAIEDQYSTALATQES